MTCGGYDMTPKERAAAALSLKIPDQVPTFELEFQLEEEMFGKHFLRQDMLKGKTEKEKEKLKKENAEYMISVYEKLEYSIIPVHYLDFEGNCDTARYIRQMTGDRFMLTTHGDGTFAIPDGDEMYEFAYSIADDPEGMKEKAAAKAAYAIENNKKLADAGIDCLILCDDYCYNSGPFISPPMFGIFIQPYLYKIIEEARKLGLYTIKHTDGNIMPILDQLVECRPHAIHSIDPMAKLDIREIKRLVGDKVCLCGNVNCALMQTGTEQEVIESAEYCLTYAKPGGGYIYCTSNVPFKGLPVERYKLILDVWKRMRNY
jgi:uroporphyrinogen decarboxylase